MSHAALEDAENDLPLFFRPLLATLCDELVRAEGRNDVTIEVQ